MTIATATDDDDSILIPRVPVFDADDFDRAYRQVIRPWREELRSAGGFSIVRKTEDGYKIWLRGPASAVARIRVPLLEFGRVLSSLASVPAGSSDDTICNAIVAAGDKYFGRKESCS